MNSENYLILAAILFSIGAIGVMVRRNALVDVVTVPAELD